MKKKNQIGFILVSTIIGFMLAVQFKSIKEPERRDTRDTWQLKSDILYEQKRQAQLTRDITELETQASRYETELKTSKEQALKDVVEGLKREVGITPVTGPGLIISINTISDETLFLQKAKRIAPDLLRRLINELNKYDAEHISINGQRVVNNTVIRDINGITKIDGYALNTFPIELKIIATDAEKVRDRLKVAPTIEEFFIENLTLTISQPLDTVTVPAYRNKIQVQNMEPVR
ncbi:DUF881 domain-containing protein [Bacillus massiliigorillae]|uniref:DUF881 domain-containing protein n=1 Tax=Bacillus massiliigorillae TaxID=1243664 RepID=UPI0003AB0C36|nr:DUF881 domain-containing protein [Bacillus massiliigorillae]